MTTRSDLSAAGAEQPNPTGAPSGAESPPEGAHQEIAQLREMVQSQGDRIARLEKELQAIRASGGWKLLTYYYKVRNRLLPVDSRRKALAGVLARGAHRLGAGAALLGRRLTAPPPPPDPYQVWIARNEPGRAELRRQRRNQPSFRPRISVVVPVYRTPPAYLRAMLDSVRNQSYRNWELCLADGASPDPEVRRILEGCARRDRRVRVAFLPQNRGIAGNSNAALELATGECVALLDHDDTLAPFALYEAARAFERQPDADFLYSDEDRIDATGRRIWPAFKPDWSPDLLRSHNYICHLVVLRRDLLRAVGGIREGFDGSQDHDLVLRAAEQARRILHVAQVLYHWRIHPGSMSRSQEGANAAIEAGRRAVQEHLERTSVPATVRNDVFPHCYRVERSLPRRPLVSILIANRDQQPTLARCLESVRRSLYPSYEVLLVENGSREPRTFEYYRTLASWHPLRLLAWDRPFNYAAVNNFAASQARGEVLLLLNNDTEARNTDWLERLLEHALRPEVGAVGAKLYYPDGTVQHGGFFLGLGGIVGHAHRRSPGDAPGHLVRLASTHNVSAVTGACLMIRKQAFDEAGGMDERYVMAYGDVDLCLSLRKRGYWNVWTPYAELLHHERKSRGPDDTPEKQALAAHEAQLLWDRWGDVIRAGDPFYSPHLTLDRDDFSLRV